MEMKKLASYFGVSLSAAYKWSAETVRRKTVIMESGAEPEIIKLIGEISQLCYVFDCKHVAGEFQTKWALMRATSSNAIFSIWEGAEKVIDVEFSLSDSRAAITELQKVKSTLESFVYGGA